MVHPNGTSNSAKEPQWATLSAHIWLSYTFVNIFTFYSKFYSKKSLFFPMRIGTFLEKSNFFSYLTPNFLLFLVSIKSARSKLQIWNFFRKILKKKVRVELWNFVETIFREGTKEKVVLTTNKNRSNERKTLRAHYSEMVGRRLKRFFASFSLRSNLNFKKKIFSVRLRNRQKIDIFRQNSW